MSSPRIKDFSVLDNFANSELFLEKRMSYTGGGLLEYVGYSKNPNELTSADTWYIVKMVYSGTNVVRYRLPSGGPKFAYVWDDRANYFP